MNFLKYASFLLILLVSISSCKDNSAKKSDKTESNKQAASNASLKEPTQFSLTIRALVESDDLFQVFFIQENSEDYTPDQFLSQEVKGSNQFQDINFNMPSEYYPINLRMDLGTNREQSHIKIKKLTLHYGSNNFTIEGNELNKYFLFNEGVTMDADSTTLYLKPHRYGDSEIYDPFILGKNNLNLVLMKSL